MIFNTSGGTVAFQNIIGNPSDNTALNNELSGMVKHSNSLPGTTTPINADQLNGVADTGYVKKYGTSTADWDTIPTAGSTKPVTSGGVASIVTQSITDGDTTHSPSGDAVNGALNAIIDWKLYNTYTILVGDSFPTDVFPTGWKEAMFVVYAERTSIACSIVICKNAWEAIPNNCYVKSGYYHSTETGDLYILKQNDTTYALRRAYINSEYKDTKVRVYYR